MLEGVLIDDSDGSIRPITYMVFVVLAGGARTLLHLGLPGAFGCVFGCWSMVRYCPYPTFQQNSSRACFRVCQEMSRRTFGRWGGKQDGKEDEEREEKEIAVLPCNPSPLSKQLCIHGG